MHDSNNADIAKKVVGIDTEEEITLDGMLQDALKELGIGHDQELLDVVKIIVIEDDSGEIAKHINAKKPKTKDATYYEYAAKHYLMLAGMVQSSEDSEKNRHLAFESLKKAKVLYIESNNHAPSEKSGQMEYMINNFSALLTTIERFHDLEADALNYLDEQQMVDGENTKELRESLNGVLDEFNLNDPAYSKYIDQGGVRKHDSDLIDRDDAEDDKEAMMDLLEEKFNDIKRLREEKKVMVQVHESVMGQFEGYIAPVVLLDMRFKNYYAQVTVDDEGVISCSYFDLADDYFDDKYLNRAEISEEKAILAAEDATFNFLRNMAETMKDHKDRPKTKNVSPLVLDFLEMGAELNKYSEKFKNHDFREMLIKYGGLEESELPKYQLKLNLETEEKSEPSQAILDALK